jgi:serine/threonine protein kinase
VALFYATEVVCTFAHLHSRSIAYRDLKPENLLIDQKGHLKFVDFGFAKVIVEKSYTLCGTPEYLAPESIEHKGHNQGVDWWALGILIYEMLSGSPPFYDDNPYNLYQKILQCQYSLPGHFQSAAMDIIVQLLDPDQTHRLGVRVTDI